MSEQSPGVAADISPVDAEQVRVRAGELLHVHQREIWCRTDRLFMGLLVFQWVFGIVLAICLSPRTWDGAKSSVHPHVWEAVFIGCAIIAAPLCFGWLRPGHMLTRHIIAISQALSSALLIHLGGGRIEMHFHVFGSLAFIAFYRDWRVLISATVVVAADHLLRGLFMPVSVYGMLDASSWRWVEHAGWVVFEDVFLIGACLESVREMQVIADRQAQLEHSYRVVEDKVQQRTRQLNEAQQELVQIARSAGMAEIATSVLHNVGNVLNSLNVSLRVATSKVEKSPVSNLSQAIGLMREHQNDLGEFLTRDERGRQIPSYLQAVSEILSGEQTALLAEMNSLGRNVEHIKQIISVQQSHARVADVSESVRLKDLLEDALRVTVIAAEKGPISVRREYCDMPAVRLDKHVILQILINLLSNAKHALLTSPRSDKSLTLRTSTAEGDPQGRIRVEVIDNGVGIDPANLTRIFNHGFTTKKDGHGFGLHSAANSVKRLGGSLSAQSGGPGTGATFILELPLQTEVLA